MRNRTKLPKWIMLFSIMCLNVGLFTKLPFPIFGTVGVLGTIIGWLLYMRVRNDDGSEIIIDTEVSTAKSGTAKSGSLSFDEKLRKVEQLKRDGLITELEYDRKRKEILNEKW